MGRAFLSVIILLSASAAIGFVFWQQELKYQRPTPIPENYHTVAVGAPIKFSDLPKGEAVFLHFYNPDCPCSRFNTRHLKSIIRSYADSVSIVVVVPDRDALPKASREFEGVKILLDERGELARDCGVYSTPQAAIIDANSKLYYRGNYNASRYCTARATNFAELSLIALLNHQPSPSFGLLATQSYGCSWEPEINKNQSIIF